MDASIETCGGGAHAPPPLDAVGQISLDHDASTTEELDDEDNEREHEQEVDHATDRERHGANVRAMTRKPSRVTR